MSGNLRAFGLTCAALLVLSAVMASAALALPQFTASSYPASVTGSNTKGGEVFTTEAGKIECDGHFLSHSLSAASSTLTVTPTYTNCKAFGSLSATVNTEGCSYVLHATEAASGTSLSHFDIACPAGKSIKITAGNCKFEFPPDTGRTSAHLVNSGGALIVTWPFPNLTYRVTQDGFLCPFNGTGEHFDTAQYSGAVTWSRVGGGTVSVSGE